MCIGPTSRAFIFIVGSVMVANAGADIYRWVDEAGQVDFGDKPPSEIEGTRVDLPAAPPPDEGELRRLRLHQQADEDSARRVGLQREQAAADRAHRASVVAKRGSCPDTRKQLDVLQERAPVYRDENGKFHVKWMRDPYQGTREYLDDATRAAEIEGVRGEISAHCRVPDNAAEQSNARRLQIRSEWCEAARAELAALERPSARASKWDLERKRQKVRDYCKE